MFDEQDDDLVMESTTDSPEQIAEGLGVTIETADASKDADTVDLVAEPAADPDGEVDAEPALEVEDADPEVTEPAVRVAAAKPRQQRKSVDGAAAAARRKAKAEAERDAEEVRRENEDLRERLAAVQAGKPDPGADTDIALPAIDPVVITPEQILDTHPEIAPLVASLAKLGAKPKQADFADLDEFEEKRDEWIGKKARLEARIDNTRDAVAARESTIRTQAKRDAAVVGVAYQRTERASRARHADYQTVMDTAKTAGWKVQPHLAQAIFESPQGAELAYYLAKNPKEVARLNVLTPHRGVVEIGIIEGRITAGSRGGIVARPPAATRMTRASDPPRSLIDGHSGRVSTTDLNDPNLSLAEYNHKRDEMDRQSGRRTH